MAAGPPHVGKRDELIKTNHSLYKQLEVALGEANSAQLKVGALEEARRNDHTRFEDRANELNDLICALQNELAEARQNGVAEKLRLEHELSVCKAQLGACSSRLERTHEALGITADKARRLESAEGRLAIDLHGTLTSLEEAGRRHELERKVAAHERQQVEGEMQVSLEAAHEHAASLSTQLEESREKVKSLKGTLSSVKAAAATRELGENPTRPRAQA